MGNSKNHDLCKALGRVGFAHAFARGLFEFGGVLSAAPNCRTGNSKNHDSEKVPKMIYVR
jgi:ABC-type sulfate transport system permease component